MIHRNQKGFTFIELMVAAAAGAIVIFASTAFMLRAFNWYDDLSGRVEMNRHARDAFSLLGYGGMSASTGNDATRYVYSMRGRKLVPAGTLRSNYALQYASNNLTLIPDKFATMSVTCLAAAKPLPDCTGTEMKNVAGWIGKDAIINSSTRSVDNRTAEVTLTITNASQSQRADNATMFSESYRTVYTLNRNESDP